MFLSPYFFRRAGCPGILRADAAVRTVRGGRAFRCGNRTDFRAAARLTVFFAVVVRFPAPVAGLILRLPRPASPFRGAAFRDAAFCETAFFAVACFFATIPFLARTAFLGLPAFLEEPGFALPSAC